MKTSIIRLSTAFWHWRIQNFNLWTSQYRYDLQILHHDRQGFFSIFSFSHEWKRFSMWWITRYPSLSWGGNRMIELLLKKVFKSCTPNPSKEQGGDNVLIQKLWSTPYHLADVEVDFLTNMCGQSFLIHEDLLIKKASDLLECPLHF